MIKNMTENLTLATAAQLFKSNFSKWDILPLVDYMLRFSERWVNKLTFSDKTHHVKEKITPWIKNLAMLRMVYIAMIDANDADMIEKSAIVIKMMMYCQYLMEQYKNTTIKIEVDPQKKVLDELNGVKNKIEELNSQIKKVEEKNRKKIGSERSLTLSIFNKGELESQSKQAEQRGLPTNKLKHLVVEKVHSGPDNG